MKRAMQKIDLESIPGTVVLAGADGIIEYANQQCLEATGFAFSEMVGHPLIDFWEIPSESLAGILQHLEDRPVWRNVMRHRKKDGTHFQEVSAVSKLPADNQKGFCLLKVGQPLPVPDQPIPPARVPDDSGRMHDDYRAIFDAAPYAIAVNRMSDQRYLLVNQAFCHYTGYGSEEVRGKTSQELNLFHDPADWQRMRAIVDSQAKLDGFEVTFRRKDFGLAHGLISVRPVHFRGELCMLYISQDIEEVQTAQEALRQSVENYRTIIEGAPVSIAITRLSDSIYQEVNDSFCRRVHYRREEILGHTPPELKFYTNLEDRRRFLELFAEQGYADDLEIRFQDKYGKTLESLVSARPLRYRGEECLLYISTRIDNLKATQRALAEREENYRTILDLAPYNIVITRRSDGVYLQVNKAFTLRTGYSADEALGRTVFDLNLYANPSDRDQLLSVLERDGHVDSMEVPFRLKNGRIVESLISMRFIHFQDQDCIISMTVEIGELKAAQRAVEESEARFRAIFETAADPIFLNDMQTGRFLDVNHAACRHLGYAKSEFLAMSLNAIHPPETRDAMPRFPEDPAESKGLFFESQHIRKDGSKAIVEVSSQQMMHGERRVLLSIVRDVTERKQIEDELSRHRKSLEQMVAEQTDELKATQRELVKKEKMAVLGQITATVSHELRNPMSVIRSSNFFLHRRIKCSDEKIKKHFNRIDEQVSLCDAIVADLLEYTEGRQVVSIYQDFAGWLAEVVEAQRKNRDIDLNPRIAADLPKISYDREKLHRVIINLINNAAQAVRARAEESEKRGVAFSPGVDIEARLEDDCLVIGVRDNGIGMDQNTLAHAFEPLFTTRARGTGLGLAIVKKIVDEHGGSVTLESRLGAGTHVRLTLPLK
jgi:PAS domain S-box-containing protein